MITDPSWLYSTIAQSSAAIVAIIGGFITASVLMLMAEKGSLTHQKADKETLLDTRRDEEKRLTDLYEAMRVDRFFNAIADDLKKEDELPSLDELIQRYPSWNLDYEILKQEYEKLSKQKLEARDFIEQYSNKIDPAKYSTFEEWVEENKLDIASYDYEILEEEYYRFRTREEERLEEEKRRAEEERKKTLPSYIRGIVELQESLRVPRLDLTPYMPQLTGFRLHQLQKEDRRLEGIESRLSMLRYEIQLLESEITSLIDRIQTFSYPPNLGWGLAVLGYLAVFGILLPVLVIANEAFFVWAKLGILTTFWLGIIGVFSYIAFQIRTLRK